MSVARFKLKKAVVSLNDGRIVIVGGAERPEIYDATTTQSSPRREAGSIAITSLL
jgi:hypothetical protein